MIRKRAFWGGVALLLALLAAPASAEERKSCHVAVKWDVDAATLTFPSLRGLNGSPCFGATSGDGRIQTSGSSTSVTETTAGSNPFAPHAVDDVLVVTRSSGVADSRVIVTYTDDSNVVVDTAVDWSTPAGGFAFTWWEFFSGTTDADGWVDVSNLGPGKVAAIQWDQGDLATGLLWEVQCRTNTLDPKPNKVYPGEASDCGPGTLVAGQCLFALAGVGTTAARVEVMLPEDASACRVGVLRSGADASDATTNREQVTISFYGGVEK